MLRPRVGAGDLLRVAVRRALLAPRQRWPQRRLGRLFCRTLATALPADADRAVADGRAFGAAFGCGTNLTSEPAVA